jgi:hypothetical protein
MTFSNLIDRHFSPKKRHLNEFPSRLLYKLFLLAILCTYLLGSSVASNNEEAEFGLEGGKSVAACWFVVGGSDLIWFLGKKKL